MTNQSVPNYLVQSILVTLFCCLPLGIVAIIQSAQVNGKLQAGDYEGAALASEQAKKYCWWGFIAGLIWIVLYVLFTILAASR
jgi:hypothetical protein